MKEYPPMLFGSPEMQIAKLREYLVRLIREIDETIAGIPAGGSSAQERAALADWQVSVGASLVSIKSALRTSDLVQHGTGSGSITFPRPYAAAPVVIATAGTVSDVTATGFSLSTAASWIAVGTRR